MDARFRIRTREGEELEPRTVEIFSELVRSGVIRSQDLVHDALTGEWVPAGVHPMVRLFQDPLVVDPLAPSLDARMARDEPEPPSSPPAPDLDGGEPGEPLQLSLVEVPSTSPEDEARAFIQRMEEERDQDPDRSALGMDVSVTPVRNAVVEALSQAPQRPAESVRPTLRAPAPSQIARRTERAGRGERFFTRARLGLAMAALAAVTLLASVAWARGRDGGTAEVVRSDVAVRAPRGVPSSEEEIRRVAYGVFLQGVDTERARQGLGEVPAVWLEGRYLADAAAFPEVRRYWERVLAYTEAVQAQEARFYRSAYLSAAQEAGVQGPVRSLRLATALEDFARHQPSRARAYHRMWELSTAALALHDVLVDLGGRVTYEPIRGQGVSADPVLEAAGTDAEAQSRLEGALDRVLLVLHGPDGAQVGDRSRVSGWLVEALSELEGDAP